MVQEAVNAACNRRPPGGRYEVHVKVGIYKENVVIPKTVRYVKMFGDGINKTVITGNQHSGGDMLETPLAGDMKDSTTFNMTFKNMVGPKGGKATTVFLIGTAVALWLGIGATLPIDKSLTLGIFLN
uniref:Pectinesterase n=1 Tax=Lactuca sativa TaxID=4236 RepID=A0A9R1WE76_LACSA|nr:hypothetical protein LSAT_V11C200098280 [Lactuca sativa]